MSSKSTASTPSGASTTTLQATFQPKLYAGAERMTGPPARALLAQAGLISPASGHSDAHATLPLPSSATSDSIERKPIRVLDNACGTGIVTSLVFASPTTPSTEPASEVLRRQPSEGSVEVVCGDLSPSMVQAVKERIEQGGWNASARVIDSQAMDFPDGAFNVVLTNFGLQSMPDPQLAVREIIRVTAAGGTVGLTNWFSVPWIPILQSALENVDFRITPRPARLPDVPLVSAKAGGWESESFTRAELSARPAIDSATIRIEKVEFDVPLEGDEGREAFATMMMRMASAVMDVQRWTEEQKVACLKDDALLREVRKLLKDKEELHWGALAVTAQRKV